MTSTVSHQNGLISPPQTIPSSTTTTPPRVVLAGKTGRILCVADIRGDYHELNKLIREHEATAVIHTGDFGFITADSLDRMGDKILRHLLQYSPLIPAATRTQLLSIPASAGRAALLTALSNSSIHFPLSQFPHLLSGAITFPVPVFTVWGHGDVQVLEKFRTGEYEVHNLSVIDEATTRVIDVGGIRLRLFGLGGALVPHKFFDNGEGFGTIAGGLGTMWTTALQIGELVATSQHVYDASETRLFIASAPISRNGLLTQVAHAVKADLTISGGLHFRYPASYNEFSIEGDFENYRQKLIQARDAFAGVYEVVKDRVDSSMNEEQLALLKKALGVTQRIPTADDGAWTNTWHWVLTDAACGHLLFSITDGRVTAETRSSGLNFSHRLGQGPAPPSAPVATSSSAIKPAAPTPARVAPVTPSPAGLPPKVPTGPAQAANQGFRVIPNRPVAPPVQPVKPSPVAAAKPTGAPAASTSSPSVSTPATAPSIPAKPQVAQPTRAPRGPSSVAGQNTAAAASAAAAKTAGKTVDPKAAPAPKPTSSPRDPKERPSSAAGKPSTNGTNGKATPTPSTSGEKSGTKPAEEKKAAPAVKEVNGDKGKTDGEADKKEIAGDESAVEAAPAPKRWSLYAKGLPPSTSEEDLKKSFGPSSEKITQVKIPWDHFNKRAKDFGYIDFSNEEDMQQALKDSTGTIGDKTINVSISNPPVKDGHASRGSRGRGGFIRGRGRGAFVAGGVNHRKEGSGEKVQSSGGDKKETNGGEK